MLIDDDEEMCTVNFWLEDQDQQLFYNGILPLEQRGPSAFQLQETMLKSDKIWYTICMAHFWLENEDQQFFFNGIRILQKH